MALRVLQTPTFLWEHHMRYTAYVAALFVLIQPVQAAVTPEVDPRASLGVVQQWIYNYRAKPDYAHVPAAMRVLFHTQSFKEPENAGIYLGFLAGAIGSNPAKAEQLVTSLFPVPPEDEWVIVRAIAYSGLPDWRNLLRKVALRMPGRKVMIDSYLAGTLPVLADIPLEETKPGVLEKLRGALTKNPFAKDDKTLKLTQTFAGNQDLLDTLWGYYFATGSYGPIARIITLLPWSKSAIRSARICSSAARSIVGAVRMRCRSPCAAANFSCMGAICSKPRCRMDLIFSFWSGVASSAVSIFSM